MYGAGAPGRKQYITQRVLDAVQFPHEPDTVPSWAVPVMSLLGPPVVICAHGALAEVMLPARHSAVLASLFSTAVSALSTNVFKLTVRCFIRAERNVSLQFVSFRRNNAKPVGWLCGWILSNGWHDSSLLD